MIIGIAAAACPYARGMDIVIRLGRRGVPPLAALGADMLLILLAGRIVAGAYLRGKLCDGASVWCTGGDPTPAEWVAEMDFRTVVTFWSFGGVTVIMLASAVWAWRRHFRALAAVQLFALVVPLFAVILRALDPYPSLH
ncbi:hypothetical protein [Sphaerisporangium perillae]|uniref:hypothetical protein n=1 Tax=Sphaerisporangium perillae TaxID=2935860 RepID=UPI00200F8671|nr:hypothetical protein [Sphaerisporangium perillae]